MATSKRTPQKKFRGTARKLAQKLRKQIGRAEETLDELENCVEGLEQVGSPGRGDAEREKHAASFGVVEFSLRFRSDDWADVDVGGIEFVLSPVLANLLDVLAADYGRCDGPLVGWKSRDALLRTLEKRFGEPYASHSLSQAKLRLLEKLGREGLSPHFVQTSCDGELRFARRREDAPSGGPGRTD